MDVIFSIIIMPCLFVAVIGFVIAILILIVLSIRDEQKRKMAAWQKLAEANPLLLTGYEGIKQQEETLPPRAKLQLNEALERLITFYETRAGEGDAAKAAMYRQELSERTD